MTRVAVNVPLSIFAPTTGSVVVGMVLERVRLREPVNVFRPPIHLVNACNG